MIYAKVENDVVVKHPYSFIDLKNDNPRISFPNTYLSQASSNGEYNVVEIIEVDPPVEEGSHPVEETPSFDGSVWTQNWKLVPDVQDSPPQSEPSWYESRVIAYGSATDQIEFITENGLEAWQTKVSEIKTEYPKV